jgi:hypothetical protein
MDSREVEKAKVRTCWKAIEIPAQAGDVFKFTEGDRFSVPSQQFQAEILLSNVCHTTYLILLPILLASRFIKTLPP